MPSFYDFQHVIENEINQSWDDGAVDVMGVAPTGGGKTTIFCGIAAKFPAPVVAIAHRQELVSQAALAFNRDRVPHDIIAPKEVIQQIIALENETHGYSSFASRSAIRVAGIDTLIRRDAAERWYSQVGLVIQDEGHHQLKENKWGRGRLMFPNARGLAMTAHAVRADNMGLGRPHDGFIDRLVIGPYGRQLINRGFLTPYALVCVKSDIDFSSVNIGSGGELNQVKLRAVTHSSKTLVGDVVDSYLKYAPGKLGITFACDKEDAVKFQRAYEKAGVPAEIIADKTPIVVRAQIMRRFRDRKILQLISVDCLGEGVDIPAVEVVSLARRTASWQLMCQQIGRCLRVVVADEYKPYWGELTDEQRVAIIAASDKPHGIIIDHVGNVAWHAERRGMPCSLQAYSLMRGERNQRHPDAIPLKICLNPKCGQPYEAFLLACPHCGQAFAPQTRSSPEWVDGDMVLLDPAVMTALVGDTKRIMEAPRVPQSLDRSAQISILRKHHARFTGQESLRKVLELWGGWQETLGRNMREAQKLFFLKYGVDIMSAQSLGATAALELEVKLRGELDRNNIIARAA